MVCIYCGAEYTRVVNSRRFKSKLNIWRRRKCLTCTAIFTTTEQIELSGAVIVTSGGNSLTEPFARDVLFTSIVESCRHRPDSIKEATELTSTIISKLLSGGTPPLITTAEIFNVALSVLKNFDLVAAGFYGAKHGKQTIS